MAMEPINIFSHRIDPRGVVLLRFLSPAVAVTGPDDAWQEATVTLTHPGRKGRARLTFRHDPDFDLAVLAADAGNRVRGWSKIGRRNP